MINRSLILLFAVTVLSVNFGCAGKGTLPPPAPLGTDPATGIEMVYVKGGCYQMGNTFDIGGPEEKPVHEVCVDDFYMSEHEVTQGQWEKLMGSNPSHFSKCGENCPVENVSWNDAQEFISRFNSKSGGSKYRLPTEAEWEYAARSGGKSEQYTGSNVDIAWFRENAEDQSHPVGTKLPNALGLYDLTGNVWEWTNDWYGSDYYKNSPRNNPAGPSSGDRRVVRGGSWGVESLDIRTTYRNYLPPGYRGGSLGFRLVRTN